MKKNNVENVDKLARRADYYNHLEEIESNPRMLKRANKIARKAKALAKKNDEQYDDYEG